MTRLRWAAFCRAAWACVRQLAKYKSSSASVCKFANNSLLETVYKLALGRILYFRLPSSSAREQSDEAQRADKSGRINHRARLGGQSGSGERECLAHWERRTRVPVTVINSVFVQLAR